MFWHDRQWPLQQNLYLSTFGSYHAPLPVHVLTTVRSQVLPTNLLSSNESPFVCWKIVWGKSYKCVIVYVWVSGWVVRPSCSVWGCPGERACGYPAAACVCVRVDVAPGLLWSSPCLISMSIDSICFAHERARMCRRTGERKGGPGMAVYLSPPCRNLYCTLSALIKDHSVVLTRSAPFSLSCFRSHINQGPYPNGQRNMWIQREDTYRILTFMHPAIHILTLNNVWKGKSRCAPVCVAKYESITLT